MVHAHAEERRRVKAVPYLPFQGLQIPFRVKVGDPEKTNLVVKGPYVTEQMRAAHEKGTPVMRPLFYDFPRDKRSWETEDEFLFGPNYLVAPVLSEGARERQVYFPAGQRWTCAWTGEAFEGGRTVTAAAPLDRIPVFSRDGTKFES